MRQDFQKTIFKKHNLVFIKKNKFRAQLLVLALFSIFISCNEEIYDIKDQHDGVDKSKISLTQFKNETNIGKVEPIISVSITKSISAKTKTQLSDFVIDTLAIKRHISENNKTTYSFRIYPLSAVAKPNEIYNLVYRKVNNIWETSIFYLKKLPERDSEHKLFEKIERIFDSKSATSKTYKAASVWDCAIEVPVVRCTLTGTCTAIKCDDCIWCVWTVISYASCSSGGSGSGGGSSDPGVTPGSGGGASDPYSYSPNYYDNPVFDDPEYRNAVQRSYVWTNLGDAAQGFFASSLGINYFNQTIQYQITNTWSPESYVFAQEMRIRKFDYPIIFNSITPFLIETKIDDTQLNACLKGIMEQLKMATNSDIANVMAKLDATNEYNLTMKMGTMQDPKNYAETIKISKNNYLTTITKDTYTSTSKLYRATALLHETIHAYMLSVVDDYNTYPTNAPFTDFPELFKIYVSKINSIDNANAAQHEDMANKYVSAIAFALEEYQWNDTGIPSLADKQVFLDMAWSGLQGTDVYDKKFPAGSADNARITARISAEQNGVYYQGQYAVGKPCN